jgi:putative tryptophan/tyrosine transport system ATP-binding protein
MVEIKNVSKVFDQGSGNKLHALDQVNLTFSEGSFNVIVGGNGSGKSTLLNLIGGSLGCDEGTILWRGRPVHKKKDFQRASFIGRIFQDPSAGTAPDLSLLENFRLAALRSKKKSLKVAIGKKFRRLVKRQLEVLGLGLENQLDKPAGQLSGGQRQAMTLIMATVDPPDILLMDEPTAALDPKSAKLVMALADSIIRENKLLALLVTHQMKEAVDYGDRLIQFHKGRVVRDLNEREKSAYKPLEIMEWFYNS